MDRISYLSELKRRLTDLPQQECKEILQDYEAHFEHARLSGREESEVIRSLGAPQRIAKEILTEYNITKAEVSPSALNIIRAIFTAFGSSVFHLLLMLLPFVAGVIVLAIVCVFSAFLVASPILLLIQDGFGWIYLQEFSLSLGLIGVGLLLMLGAIWSTRMFYLWMVLYIKFALSRMRREPNEISYEESY